MKVLAISGSDGNGYVQSVKLKIGKTRNSDEDNRILERPLSKIVLFVEQECVFDSPSMKRRKSELVQDILVILGMPCVDAPWWSAP